MRRTLAGDFAMNDLTFSRRGMMGALAAGAAIGAIDLGTPGAAFAQARLSGSKIDAALKDAYDKYKALNEGKNADYIPALAEVPSNYFGIALVSADGKAARGRRYQAAVLDPVDLQGLHRRAGDAAIGQPEARGNRRRRLDRAGVQLDHRDRAVQRRGDEPVRQSGRHRHGRQRQGIHAPTTSGTRSSNSIPISLAASSR